MATPTFQEFLQTKYGANAPSVNAPNGSVSGTDTTNVDAEQEKWKKIWAIAPDIKTKNALADSWKSAHGYELFGQPTISTTQKKESDAQQYKKDVIGIANQLKTVIANKDKYTPEQYNQIVDSYTSALTIKQKEAANFGASLTANELAILAGQIPVRAEVTPTFGETAKQFLLPRFLGGGVKPPQTGRVMDSEQQILNKLNVLIPQLSGQQIDPTAFNNGTSQVQSQGKSLGGLVQNAGSNAGEIINSILGIPAQSVDLQKKYGSLDQSLLSGQGPARDMLRDILFPFRPAVQEGNQLLGEPLKGGDIAGRIVDRAYQKPVTTAMDIAAILPFFKGKGAVLPESIKPVESVAPGVTSDINPIQNILRKTADVTRGGGSKEYLLREGKNPSTLPQNQVLMDEGILTHPTVTGQTKATGQAMQRYGSQIGEVYKNAEPVLAKDIKSSFAEKMSNYPEPEVKKLLPYIENYGKFDLKAGDTTIKASDLWEATKKLEEKPPKIVSKVNPPQYYADMAKDAARALREVLADKNPSIKLLNQKYSALADFAYNVLQNPQGISGRGGVINAGLNAGKALLDSALNVGYKVANPSKLIRDMRYKQGNAQFRK